MHMRIIFGFLLILGISGFGEDSPAAPEPTINITPHTHTTTFGIQEWDPGRLCVTRIFRTFEAGSTEYTPS
jgi:hypothetical protein